MNLKQGIALILAFAIGGTLLGWGLGEGASWLINKQISNRSCK